MERLGFGYEAVVEAQPAADLRGRHRLRPDRALCPQGRPGRAGAGDVRRDARAAPTPICRSRSIRPRSPIIRPACTWCRACCWRCCSGPRPARASASASRCSTRCWRRRPRKAAAHLMRGREVNWGAMPLSGVFETTDGALVLVGAFKANPLRDICTALGNRRPVDTIRALPRMRSRSRTSRHCMRFSASASRPTPRPIGSARLEAAGSALRAGPDAGRGAGRRADRPSTA